MLRTAKWGTQCRPTRTPNWRPPAADTVPGNASQKPVRQTTCPASAASHPVLGCEFLDLEVVDLVVVHHAEHRNVFPGAGPQQVVAAVEAAAADTNVTAYSRASEAGKVSLNNVELAMGRSQCTSTRRCLPPIYLREKEKGYLYC